MNPLNHNAVIATALICVTIVFVAWMLLGFPIPFRTAGNELLQGDSNVGDLSNEQTPANPTITIYATPNAIRREGITTITAESNVPYGRIHAEIHYRGTNVWWSIGYYTLGANGMLQATGAIDNFAGEFDLRATLVVSGVQSNIAPLTVYGIALYQQKINWLVGETYTAMLTGTYRNWRIFLFIKNASSTTWSYVTSGFTDNIGMVPYGQNTALITPDQAGTTKNLIAIVSATDASGTDVDNTLIEAYQGQVPNSVIDNMEGAGYIVKSNILTVSVT